MNYTTIEDFYLIIQDKQLTQLIGLSGNSMLDLSVEMALSEVKSYLVQKYDMVFEYAQTGTSRSLQVVMAVVDISLYILHSRIAPNNIPELRQKRYDQTISWLKNCAKGFVTPALTEIDLSTTGSKYRFGNFPPQPNNY
jgi:phage gp36-like protein